MRFSPSSLRFSKAGLFGVCLLGAFILLLTSVAFAQSDPDKLTGKARAEYARQQAIERRAAKLKPERPTRPPLDKDSLLTEIRKQVQARRAAQLQAFADEAAVSAACADAAPEPETTPKNRGQAKKAERLSSPETKKATQLCRKEARLDMIRTRAAERRSTLLQNL